MELKINGKEQQVKFNFASLKLWEDKITDANGDKQTDREVFDQLFTGLVQKTPRTLVDIVNGGLAYLGNKKPTYSEVFDAVSDLMGSDGLNKLAQDLMAELTAVGFFKGSMGQWINSIKKQINNFDKYLQGEKPAKNASKDAKEAYQTTERRYKLLKEQSMPMLNEFDKMLKATGTTL